MDVNNKETRAVDNRGYSYAAKSSRDICFCRIACLLFA